MKAITLTQPWATLLVLGLKEIETRSWSTSYRGPIAIHAAKGYPAWAREFAEELAIHGLEPANFPTGVILGTAFLGDCKTTALLVARGLVSIQEDSYGDFSAGRYGFVMENPVPLPEPIPCKGALGLWDVPPEIEAQMKEAKP